MGVGGLRFSSYACSRRFLLWVVCVCLVLISGCVPSLYSECDVICSLLMFVSDASSDNIVEIYSIMGLVVAFYVVSIVSFCFPHVVDVSALTIMYCLRDYVVVYDFGVESQS